MSEPSRRKEFAIEVCRSAGDRALTYFQDRDNLKVDVKGAQDWVSEADKNVETFIREEIAKAWPEDGIYGEEHADTTGTSGFDWVIDPIDGTTNFVNGIPAWTIVLAGVSGGRTEVGVIFEPNVAETYVAERGKGATLNGRAMSVASGVPFEAGTISVGYSMSVVNGQVWVAGRASTSTRSNRLSRCRVRAARMPLARCNKRAEGPSTRSCVGRL